MFVSARSHAQNLKSKTGKFLTCITLDPLPIAGMPFYYLLLQRNAGFCMFSSSDMYVIREECACNPVRYFAILSTQRSGSGWFETLLNSHVNISSNGEIFSVKVRRANASTILGTLDKLYNLDWFSSASKNECTAAVGLKWMLNQVSVFHILPFLFH